MEADGRYRLRTLCKLTIKIYRWSFPRESVLQGGKSKKTIAIQPKDFLLCCNTCVIIFVKVHSSCVLLYRGMCGQMCTIRTALCSQGRSVIVIICTQIRTLVKHVTLYVCA